MRNLSITELAYLFTDGHDIADVQAMTDVELSTALGIAMTQVEFEEGCLDGFTSVEHLLEYQADVEKHAKDYDEGYAQNELSDEPF